MDARPRRPGRALLTVLLAVLLTVVAAPAATAHTELVGTDPADGQVLAHPPSTLTLTFTEPVGVAPQAVQLLDASGEPVPLDVQALDSTVGLTPSAALGSGTHTVAWRVVSSDGHPISGSFSFAVGAPTTTAVEVPRGAPPSVVLTHRAAQTLVHLGVFATSGLVVFDLLLLAAPDGAVPLLRRRLRRLMRAGTAVAVLGAVTLVPATALWQDGAGPGTVTGGALWGSAAGSGAALAAALATAGLLVAVLAAPRATGRGGTGATRAVALGGAGLAAASLLVTGHTRSAEPGWLVLAAGAVHVVAGLTWTGGLLGVVTALRAGADVPTRQLATTLARFSAVAGWVVLALAATGLALGWRILGSTEALVSTGYGRLLLLKVAVVLGAVLIAARNRFVHLPRVLDRPDPAARAGLRTAVRAEGALLVLVLVFTGTLTTLSP